MLPTELFSELMLLAKEDNKATEPSATAYLSAPMFPPASMPEYRTGAQTGMAHIHQSTVPESNLRMGTLGLPTKTLWDTGAYYNMMSLNTANALRLEINKDGQLPTFALADAHTAPCMGRVHTPVRLGPGIYLRPEFLIIAESPYPAILGSHFFHTEGVIINYETSTIELNVGTHKPQFRFAAGPTIGLPRPVTTLSVESAVTIPPNTEMNIPVKPSGHAHLGTGTWGLISDAGLHGVHVVNLRATHTWSQREPRARIIIAAS